MGTVVVDWYRYTGVVQCYYRCTGWYSGTGQVQGFTCSTGVRGNRSSTVVRERYMSTSGQE